MLSPSRSNPAAPAAHTSCFQVRSQAAPGRAPTQALPPFRNESHQGRRHAREGRTGRLPRPRLTLAAPSGFRVTPCVAGLSTLALHRSPHAAGRGLQRRVYWGGGTPAVGPLTSFQPLPFINIYSSSSTKNNILEPREEKKINAKHRELGSTIMCVRAEWTPEQGRG